MSNVKLLYIFVSILLSTISHISAHKYTLSICAIFQNEAPYLKEWIDYHRKVGVEHFWLYNNLSTDNYVEVLQPFIDKHIVELIEWPLIYKDPIDFFHNVQSASYNNCILISKNRTKWLAVIDIDEFIIPLKDDDIRKFLIYFENEVGIAINWQIYGTSNIWDCEGKILSKLVWRAETNYESNRHIKSICRPEMVQKFLNPHFPFYTYKNNVDENHNIVEGCVSNKVSVERIKINHYWTRDEKYLMEVKFPRRIKWGEKWDLEKIKNDLNKVYDPILLN